MKTYIVTLSQFFQKKHKRNGQPTHFREKFQNREKIHTIRAAKELWFGRFDDIYNQEALLSMRQWSGKPYASKQIILADLTAAKDGIGVQELIFEDNDLMKPRIVIKPNLFYPEGKLIPVEPALLAKNDGLSLDDWIEWFRSYDISEPMVIIHFTSFRYTD